MTRRGQLFLVLLAVFATLVSSRFAYRPSGAMQLLLIVLLPVIALAVITGVTQAIRRRGRSGWWTLAAVAGCIASLPLGVRIGGALRDSDFVNRRRALYAVIVDRFERGDIVVKKGVVVGLRPPEVDEDLAELVDAHRDDEGALTVRFLWGGGFPAKHTWYVYCSSASSGDDDGAPSPYRRLDAHWFIGHD
jgi:hypothetical protein